jgi:replication-associated recombination protein RarA
VADVPEHLKNIKVPTAGGKDPDQDAEYVYPHDHPGHFVVQEYGPGSARYYVPTREGYEDIIGKRMHKWAEQARAQKDKKGSSRDD